MKEKQHLLAGVMKGGKYKEDICWRGADKKTRVLEETEKKMALGSRGKAE